MALIGHGCSSALAVPCHSQAEIITRTRGKGTKSASLTASDSADRCSRHHAGRAPLGSFGDAAFHTSGRTAPAMEGSACVDAPRHTAASPRHGSGGQRFASLAEAAQLFAWLPGPPGVKITPVLPQYAFSYWEGITEEPPPLVVARIVTPTVSLHNLRSTRRHDSSNYTCEQCHDFFLCCNRGCCSCSTIEVARHYRSQTFLRILDSINGSLPILFGPLRWHPANQTPSLSSHVRHTLRVTEAPQPDCATPLAHHRPDESLLSS